MYLNMSIFLICGSNEIYLCDLQLKTPILLTIYTAPQFSLCLKTGCFCSCVFNDALHQLSEVEPQEEMPINLDIILGVCYFFLILYLKCQLLKFKLKSDIKYYRVLWKNLSNNISNQGSTTTIYRHACRKTTLQTKH